VKGRASSQRPRRRFSGWRLIGGLALSLAAVLLFRGRLERLPEVVLGSYGDTRSAAPATRAATRSAKSPVILRRGNGPEPESLDPHGARSEAALTILRDLYEGITAIGADGAPVLAAADHYDVSPDGKSYRFHLRAAHWSNGEAVVAEDFAAAWRRLVDPHTGAQYADILKQVRGAAAIASGAAAPATLGVHADDARTLAVELAHPTPYFLSVLAHPATFPINRHSLAVHGRGFAKPGVMVSNGAFVLTRWDFGSHLVAVRNAEYWDDKATQLDGVEYYSFADAATELRAFRTGQVDVTSSIPAAQLRWIKEHWGQMLHVAPQLAVYYLGLNLRKPPFDKSRELRQALSLTIDRERLVQSITGAGEAPAYTFVPTEINGYSPPVPEYAAWSMPQRTARARQLLRDGGMEGNTPTVELRYNSGELHNRIAVAVAQMWRDALGINVTLRAEEFSVLLQDIERGDGTVFRASWLGDYDDAYGFLQVLQSGSGVNLPHYANPAYDDLLERAASENDRTRRRTLLQNAEALMLADQPLIPLFFYVSKHLVDVSLRGWHDNAMNVVYSKNLAKVGAEFGK
jgi:oligopeptide transport system substrate-binding protein